jgi:hypothetical protein
VHAENHTQPLIREASSTAGIVQCGQHTTGSRQRTSNSSQRTTAADSRQQTADSRQQTDHEVAQVAAHARAVLPKPEEVEVIMFLQRTRCRWRVVSVSSEQAKSGCRHSFSIARRIGEVEKWRKERTEQKRDRRDK